MLTIHRFEFKPYKMHFFISFNGIMDAITNAFLLKFFFQFIKKIVRSNDGRFGIDVSWLTKKDDGRKVTEVNIAEVFGITGAAGTLVFMFCVYTSESLVFDKTNLVLVARRRVTRMLGLHRLYRHHIPSLNCVCIKWIRHRDRSHYPTSWDRLLGCSYPLSQPLSGAHC